MFFLIVNDSSQASLGASGADFGHSIKAMRLIYHAARILQLPDLESFAATAGRRMLARAYRGDSGAWLNGYGRGGVPVRDLEWWVHTELDQFAWVRSLHDATIATCLCSATEYYFNHFVDPVHGEVWAMLDGDTQQPARESPPKFWHWKGAFHTFEHTLLGYIAAQQMHSSPVTLYYAFGDEVDRSTIQPYLLHGRLTALKAEASRRIGVYRAEFRDIR